MLILLLTLPLLGSLFLLLIEDHSISAEKSMKKIALGVSALSLMTSILMWIRYDSSVNAYQFGIDYTDSVLSVFHLNLGIDGTSLYFVLLTAFITPLCLLSNWTDITEKLKYFIISFLLLETLQMAAFTVLDLFLFYIFFESVLIPLFVIILTWGASEAKERAAFLIFLYTFFGSLFMLLAIVTIYNNLGSTDFQLLSLVEISVSSQTWLWLAFFLAFAVKTPVWPLNTWLIKAHVEAPLAGSILLAGTILKLATYGYLRVLLPQFPDASSFFTPTVQAIAIVSLVYGSLSTLRQIDTKAVIAYSSVAHMAIVVLGIFSNTLQGLEGGILLGLGHGFVSPALFVCCGGIIYARTHSRVLIYHRGLTYYMPIFSLFFFIFTLFNTGIPLSLNFVGEILSLVGTWFRNPLVAVFGATGIVLSACYSLFFYNRIAYGSYAPNMLSLKDVDRREFFLLLGFLLPVVGLGLWPNPLLAGSHYSISHILYTLCL